MYKLLIIDDETYSDNRKEIYEFAFSKDFEIKCIESDEIQLESELKSCYYDCVILDNNLDKGLNKDDVLEKIKEYQYPVIMVSNSREFSVGEFLASRTIDCISLSHIFALRNVQNRSSENDEIQNLVEKCLRDLKDRVERDIFEYHGYKSDVKDSLTICHISDIQFCDPKAEENDIRTFFDKLAEFLLGLDSQVDILIITGDIVFSGKENEFREAKDYIKKFLEKMRASGRKLDIMLVPGNHDYDYQYFFTGAKNCKLDVEEVKKLNCFIEEDGAKLIEKKGYNSEGKDVEKKFTPDMFKDFKAEPVFLYNFKEFAYELTKDEKYSKKNFCIRNEKYQKSGFVLQGINNSYRYHKNIDGTKRYFFEYDYEVVGEMVKPLFSIIAGHIDPRSLGYDDICSNQQDRCSENLFRNRCCKKGQCEKWGDMERFFKKTNSIIYLSGHVHTSDIEVSKDKGMLFISATTPNGMNPGDRKLNVIQIKRGEEHIDAIVSAYSIGAEKIYAPVVQSYQYDLKCKKWAEPAQ